MEKRIIDLSLPIYHEFPVYPGDPIVSIVPVYYTEADGYRMTHMMLSTHVGTHIDPGSHIIGHKMDRQTKRDKNR